MAIYMTCTLEGKVDVPEMFTPHHPFEYPEHNKNIFEDWYYRTWKEEDARDRVYLPITWTAYYCGNKYGKNRKQMQELQNFVHRLDRSKKYYTIVQYDDGIVTNLRGLDIRIYAMSGPRIDYPLPLLCEPHPYELKEERTLLANFVGGQTHPIRKELFRYFRNKGDVNFSFRKVDCESYCRILARSVFTLCPRGYGQSSFRIAEALQYGSIPVYVSDQHILPHNHSFIYGLLIQPNGIRSLDTLLRRISEENIEQMQQYGREAYRELFSYEGSKKRILEDLCLKN
jgi:hypothetical protein